MQLNLADSALTAALLGWLSSIYFFLKALLGFSVIIFVHELGHFLAAKWTGIRVDRFAVGLGPRVCGYRGGEGFTFGAAREYSADEVSSKGLGETDYCLKALPLGGYVKMLGEDDIVIDEATGEVKPPSDPRAFTNRPVGSRMLVVSAGVVFNLIFAGLALMAVFLIGQRVISPRVGIVPADSPAQGKLLLGDRILEVNGARIESFIDLRLATIFAPAGKDIELLIERDEGGERVTHTVSVTPRMEERDGLRTLDVDPLVTTVRTRDGNPSPGRPAEENVKKGDRIIAVAGQPVRAPTEILDIFARSDGRELAVTVERPNATDPRGPPQTVTCYQRALIAVGPADARDQRKVSDVDNAHILGMLRRRIVDTVIPGSAAEAAGFQRGDVLAAFGAIANPTYDEIIATITANAGKPVPVVVDRAGGRVEFDVTPRRPFSFWGQQDAKIGVNFSARAEELTPRVAMVVPGTAAADAGIPRGALLKQVDGAAVSDWFEVIERLRAAAGRAIELQYSAGGDEVTTTLAVPSSIVNELGLPPGAIIWSVAVEEEGSAVAPRRSASPATLTANPPASTKARGLSVVSPEALRKFLEENVGRTVVVRYSSLRTENAVEARFDARPDNCDPWQMRVLYVYDPLGFELAMETVDAGGNPLLALYMGGKLVVNQVYQGYIFFSKMLTREVGTQHVAGPVGIFDAAIESAKLGWSEMLFFLASLSISLAVMNFMPIPLMDGGLMVFLLIEKIKGKPLSFRTQMISSLIGLAGIVLIGLLVTIQDITRLFQ